MSPASPAASVYNFRVWVNLLLKHTVCSRSSHLGIHTQKNACCSVPRSQTVFIHFKTGRKSAQNGKYEVFVLGHCCQLYLFQPHILTNKYDIISIIMSYCSNFQLLLTALQENTPASVLLGIKQMHCIVLIS